MLQWTIMNMLEINEKIESLRTEIENIKKNQMENLELKHNNNWNLKLSGGTWQVNEGQREEPVNLKTEQ